MLRRNCATHCLVCIARLQCSPRKRQYQRIGVCIPLRSDSKRAAAIRQFDGNGSCFSATAGLLAEQNGTVLIAGGEDYSPPPTDTAAMSAETYDPASGAFSRTGDMTD